MEFDAWAADALDRGDIDELIDFRSRAPGMPYAHPTTEHFAPLFVTLGAATKPDAAARHEDRRLLVRPLQALRGAGIGAAKSARWTGGQTMSA